MAETKTPEILPVRDEFFWLEQINKATLVINTDEGLSPKAEAKRFADAIEAVFEEGEKPGAVRPKAVIKLEPLLIEKAGPRITILHVGRSSQDMHSTYRLAMCRDNAIRVMHALNGVAEAMTAMAEDHRDTLVVNYTNGVAAQPNTLGHYLVGLLAGFNRDRERLTEFLKRFDYCPMGSTVLNGTSWPLNRRRMASFLGFSDITHNCYDGTLGINVDMPVEFAEILQSIGLHICTFIQDISVQYAQSRPWMILQESADTTYVSSAMPQKRNPGLMVNTRSAASQTIADAAAILIRAHNIIPGMMDAKNQSCALVATKTAVGAINMLTRVVKALKVDKARALEELNNDWTASQEIADAMMREYGLPFRVGHHVASKMVSFARANAILPLDFPYEQMKAIYAEVIQSEYPEGDTTLPMSEAEFRSLLNPRDIINRRAVEGGPQPAAFAKQLTEQKDINAKYVSWVEETKASIQKALDALNADFNKLR